MVDERFKALSMFVRCCFDASCAFFLLNWPTHDAATASAPVREKKSIQEDPIDALLKERTLSKRKTKRYTA